MHPGLADFAFDRFLGLIRILAPDVTRAVNLAMRFIDPKIDRRFCPPGHPEPAVTRTAQSRSPVTPAFAPAPYPPGWALPSNAKAPASRSPSRRQGTAD